MTRYMLLILTGSALGVSSIQAALFDLKLNIRVAIQSCTGVKGGPKTKCRQVVNAIGDKVNIPLSQLKIQPLDLSQPDQDLVLPVTAGTRTAYSFVPSQGYDLAGKTVYLVFDNVAQRPGTKDFGKMVIKMYRNVKNVDQEGSWTEVGNLNFGNLNMPFSVKPDGTFTAQDTQFLLGQTVINT